MAWRIGASSAAVMAAMATVASAAPAPRPIDILARDVERVESARAVKDVQRHYAQFSQFGRWDSMAALFADNATLRWGEETVTGRAAIAAWLRAKAGAMDGVRPGSLHTEIIDEPLENLSPDGKTAKARWMGLRFLGDGAGKARIEGGLYENEYVREAGGWRISAMVYHPQYEGDYADGWTNVGGKDLPIVPPHFTTDETGVPIPPATGAAPRTSATVASLASRIARLNDEDAVRNVQNAYGYYVDRRMWTDVVDLFADDAAVRIAGVGDYAGRDGVRRAMERMGPEGLTHGQLNDRPIFDLIVQVSPDGREAIARGIEVGMLGDADKRQGAWEFSVFHNRFVKQGGIWKLQALNLTPLVRADYAEGWGKGGEGAVSTKPTPPAFLPVARPAPAPVAGAVPSLDDLARKLARSSAYDGVENVSSAYGFYIDDFQWPQMAAIFAVKGNKQSPFAGYYLGRDRILGAVNASWGPAPKLRAAISFHWRTQPVIQVSQDGRSANLRTRLFQPRTSKAAPAGPSEFYMGGVHAGMYPNEQAVLEDGVWRLWSVTIDEHYFASPDWKGGWASAVDRPDGAAPPPSKLLTIYPPDVKISDLGRREEGFRGGTGKTITWPGILPMWFNYRNLVSGRTPERYWPDCVPCEALPDARMTAHGYQAPPTGPQVDGVDLGAPKASENP
ncbi:nuclear transport factor 2 family protein [Caulobacter sp.]|uniref:nuclear transport factor 2 family protein n=1 Tax=Caulobacter sp. TaxID=78 RepID=UPI002B4590B6|nr:nuclear transport factor 2 family protein [Caulobacter sp.]HJV41393.1 nuclear transport factor 2 family protein [Caulobacter sp.]